MQRPKDESDVTGFPAAWVVVREELLILASCLLRPMSRNSVLEEFRVRRFAVIEDEI